MKLITVLILFISIQAFGNIDCSPLGVEHGCFYKPEKIVSNDKLIIYFRGLFEGRSKVPIQKRMESINELENRYKLHSWSIENKTPIYLMSTNYNFITKDQISKLATYMGLSENYKLIFISHSGGYRGLYHSLNELDDLKLEKLIMLDNFYMDMEWIPTFKNAMKDGVQCIGFLTKHNLRRYTERFAPSVECRVEGPENFDHLKDVSYCLSKYIQGKLCKDGTDN
jgi:hypothetical protein